MVSCQGELGIRWLIATKPKASFPSYSLGLLPWTNSIHKKNTHRHLSNVNNYTKDLKASESWLLLSACWFCVSAENSISSIFQTIYGHQDKIVWDDWAFDHDAYSTTIHNFQEWVMSCLPETCNHRSRRHTNAIRTCDESSILQNWGLCHNIHGSIYHMHGFAQGPTGREESVLLKPAPSWIRKWEYYTVFGI